MNWLPQDCFRLAPSGELSFAIEDHDVENDVAPREDPGRDFPRALRHFIAEVNPFARGKAEGLRRGVGVDNTARQVLRSAALPSHLSQRAELDASARRMKIEHALRELGDLGDAAGDGDARHGMGAQIFQHAADEIAHVEQRGLWQIVERLDRRLRGRPVAPATWVRPVARATSMPRWIEAIHAAQE